MNLPDQDSATGRGLKAGSYAALSAILTSGGFVWLAAQGVPGCSEAIIAAATQQGPLLFIALGGIVGIPAGIMSFAVNVFRKGVKNY